MRNSVPAIGIGALVFLLVQALLSWFVYAETKQYGSRSPLVAGISVFVLGVALAVVFGTVVELLVVELLVVLLYHVGVRRSGRRSVAP